MIFAFKNMPLLVFFLIAFLLWIGVRALKARTIRYRQLYILPSVFLAISANQMFNTYALGLWSFLSWAIATVLAAVVSWRLAEQTSIHHDHNKGTIELPGTWVTLCLILLFIAARLYFGRQLYVTPELQSDQGFIAQILGTTGLICGYYLGRSGSYLIRYFRTTAR
jgi:hypothetical protein